MYDVVIIGAGIVGTAIARDLSRYDLKILLLDKENDVSNGATKANSAIIHAGYDAVPGTLKAELNVRGNGMYDRLSRELNVPFSRIGSLVIGFTDPDMGIIKDLYDRGVKNGVPGMEIIGAEALHKLEPYVNGGAKGALLARTGGITSPYEMCIAQAENAVQNGAELLLEAEVTGISRDGGSFAISTSRGVYHSKYLVNAAGLFADRINDMLGGEHFEIVPRRGEYCLFDKSQRYLATHVLFQTPSKMGKGVLVTGTVHGNLLIGPDAVDIDDKEDVSTTADGIASVIAKARRTVNGFSMRDLITSFAGLRASTPGGDFIIDSPSEGAVNAAGIDSPGLTSAPAISEMVIAMLKDMGLELTEKDFNPYRNVKKRFAEMAERERAEAIGENPLYGRVICRCEMVTEAEIVDAIRRPVGARTVDGVKRRVRAGMGRCQGGFCLPRVVDILARELKVPYTDVLKDGRGSNLITGKLKDEYVENGGDGND